MTKEKKGLWLIRLIAIFTVSIFLFSNKIPQNIGYHHFSDTKAFISIPNTLNVLSNLPFLIIGIFALYSLFYKNKTSYNIVNSNKLAYLTFFLGISLVGFGSSYYHLWPSNNTLVWDRLPMTFAFMGLFSIIIGEYISEKKARLLLFPLLIVGILSVLYWWYSESQGSGDLRYYIVVQFFPIITIPIILLFFKSQYNNKLAYWILLTSYIAAKFFEYFDFEIHQTLIFISGHSIKHIIPCIGIYILLKSYIKNDFNNHYHLKLEE